MLSIFQRGVFNSFGFENLKGDIFGGLTASVVSLPMALAFGVASGAGAVAGLYGAILVGLFAAIFGGTSTLISEPTGPMTVVMTAVLTTMMANYPDTGLAMAFTVVMIAGVFQILLGVLKLGKYITLMPYSVISGFMSGIGFILIILQIAPFLGQAPPSGGVIGTLTALPELWQQINPLETMIAGLSLALLFLIPKKWGKSLPPQLIVLVLGTVVCTFLFSDSSMRKIGEIPFGWPTLYLPTFTPDMLTTMILDGLVLGTLGCIDSLLTAVIADSLTRQEHKSDKELVGQGIGNLVSGVFGGLPGAGATMGTVVNIQAGGRTALSGIIRAIILLVVMIGAADLTKHIPLAVLAAIAIKVGFNILDWSFVKRVHRVSRTAALIMTGVLLLTVFFDLIVAVGLGVFIANILTIQRLSELQTRNVKVVGDSSGDIVVSPDEKDILDSSNGQVALVYLSGPMIFGVSKAIAREHNAIRDQNVVVLDLHDVPLIDTTVSLAIENTIKDLVDSEGLVFVVKPQSQAKASLERLGVFQLIPGTHLCDTRKEALEKAASAAKHMQKSDRFKQVGLGR
ncbi:MAG: SulP family inorganic anion transporter [Pseudobacteriovorax sp.]|nr:SulP family inorganic anion transporter [Pseudobacteriovorax sp.]